MCWVRGWACRTSPGANSAHGGVKGELLCKEGNCRSGLGHSDFLAHWSTRGEIYATSAVEGASHHAPQESTPERRRRPRPGPPPGPVPAAGLADVTAEDLARAHERLINTNRAPPPRNPDLVAGSPPWGALWGPATIAPLDYEFDPSVSEDVGFTETCGASGNVSIVPPGVCPDVRLCGTHGDF